MAGIYALVSPGGSPGVTTAALAMALSWPDGAIVAECDPGGGDVLAGLLTGHVPAARGLTELAMEAERDQRAAADSLRALLVPLDAGGTRTLLPGVTDPRQAPGIASAWPAIAAAFAAQPEEVIADCGRLDGGTATPRALLAAARTVVLVMRPTLRQVWLARSRADMLDRLLGGRDRLALLLTGAGDHSPREVTAALQLPVSAVLPHDPRTAALLSDGAGARRLGTAPLLRAARTAAAALRERADAPSPSPAGAAVPS